MLNAEQIEIFGLDPPIYPYTDSGSSYDEYDGYGSFYKREYDSFYHNRCNYEKYQVLLIELVRDILNYPKTN